MGDGNLLLHYGIAEEDLARTPASVLDLLLALQQENLLLKKRLEELEARLNKDSSNSSKPPSSDKPYKKKSTKEEKKSRAGAKKGHKGHRQELLEPTKTEELKPEVCSCGCAEFSDLEPYYTHQQIELPEIKLDVLHLILHKGHCAQCGKVNKAIIPQEYRPGYGPRMSALIGEIAGAQGDSRTIVQSFCAAVLGFHISLGAIQKVLDRVSAAISIHHERRGGKTVQSQPLR